MNIVLIGLRGSGKSKIGRLLKERISWELIDIDQEIHDHEKKSIAEIVKNNGWEYFRKIEKEVTKKISTTDKTIISTGGGTIMDIENAENLKKNGFIIYLHREPELCVKYIKNNLARPALTDEKNPLEEMKKIYEERDPVYRKYADLIIERSEDIEKDTNKIIEKSLKILSAT